MVKLYQHLLRFIPSDTDTHLSGADRDFKPRVEIETASIDAMPTDDSVNADKMIRMVKSNLDSIVKNVEYKAREL